MAGSSLWNADLSMILRFFKPNINIRNIRRNFACAGFKPDYKIIIIFYRSISILIRLPEYVNISNLLKKYVSVFGSLIGSFGGVDDFHQEGNYLLQYVMHYIQLYYRIYPQITKTFYHLY
ncbi:hypothetical protein RIR_jg10259.t1 [Rhizophagus irregularis DAOM 181602=DAOM 197198]|nr:hypothetical protein RIR_jg10259.t1 [Rhizophagus irregularis DAOM 181602=DAOM 197198]